MGVPLRLDVLAMVPFNLAISGLQAYCIGTAASAWLRTNA